MATLNSSYQYIGRSNGVQAYGASYYFYILLYAKTSGSVATGKHTVSVKMRLACTVDSTFYGYYTTAYVKVAGNNAISWSSQQNPNGSWSGSLTEGGVTYGRYVDLKEGTVEVDTKYLSKDVTIEASWIRDSISTTPPNWLPKNAYATASITATLPLIPSASTITSAANVTLGDKCSVKWTPKSASFRYKLKFSISDWSYTTGAIHPNKTTEYIYSGYSIPLDVAKKIPNSKTGTMTVTLYSYSDSGATSQIGSADSKTFTITVPDNASTKPAISMTLSPVSSLPSAFSGLYIQGMTKVKATLSATGQYGADIASYSMKVDGSSYGSGSQYTSAYLSTSGGKTVYGYATDKRGFTGETSKTITVIPYSDPKLEGVSAVRCDGNGTPSDNGTYLKITAKRSYSPVVSSNTQKNFCEIRYRYAADGSYGSWVTILAKNSLSSDAVTTQALLNGSLSTQASYTVQVRAIDDVGRYSDAFISIPTAKVYWHRDGANNALGLGKYNERKNAIDSAWDFFMNSHKITGVSDPVGDTDVVSLGFLNKWVSKGHFTGDANTVTYNAFMRTSDGATNCPSANGFLIAFSPASGQVVFQMGCDFNGSGLKYRTYWYGTWYDWKTFG